MTPYFLRFSGFLPLSPFLSGPSVSFVSISHILLGFDSSPCRFSSMWALSWNRAAGNSISRVQKVQRLGTSSCYRPSRTAFIHPMSNWTKPCLIITMVSQSACCAFQQGFPILRSTRFLVSPAFSRSDINAIKSCGYSWFAFTRLYVNVHECSLSPNVVHGLFCVVVLSVFMLGFKACRCHYLRRILLH